MADVRFEQLNRLACGTRALYTMTLLVLGVGYLFAMMQVFEVHAGRDGKSGLSTTDLVIAYSGSHAHTRLEGALKGPMKGMLPEQEREIIFAWIHDKGDPEHQGGSEEAFNETVKPIIEQRCLSCHDGKNPHIPDLSSYAGVSQVVEMDTGMDIFSLIRISHIHLFGMTFIFYITSTIFVQAYVRPVWLKCTIIATPFIAILLDISSWYLTKIYTGFAWVVMIGGALMALTFATQWLVSMYQMWFYKGPLESPAGGGVIPVIEMAQEHAAEKPDPGSSAVKTKTEKSRTRKLRAITIIAFLALVVAIVFMLSRCGEQNTTRWFGENGNNVALTDLEPMSPEILAMIGSGDSVSGRGKAVQCVACHGEDGTPPNPDWPILAGQNAEYIVTQLLNYRSGTRGDPVMLPLVEHLSDEDIADLAVFYEEQQRKQGDPVDAGIVAVGERLYQANPEHSGSVACAGCHGSNGQGEPDYGVPVLNGQHAAYLFAQLVKISGGLREHPQGKSILAGLTKPELEALSLYLQQPGGIGESNVAARPASAADVRSGEAIYNQACRTCHASGLAGAPTLGDKAAWAPRIAQGMDTLLNSTINGKSAMPPRGSCASCSDDDLRVAIEFMISSAQ